jgi:hypothetical protein
MDPTPNPSAPAGSLWEKALTQIGNEQLKAVLETTARTQKRDILVCASADTFQKLGA